MVCVAGRQAAEVTQARCVPCCMGTGPARDLQYSLAFFYNGCIGTPLHGKLLRQQAMQSQPAAAACCSKNHMTQPSICTIAASSTRCSRKTLAVRSILHHIRHWSLVILSSSGSALRECAAHNEQTHLGPFGNPLLKYHALNCTALAHTHSLLHEHT